MLGMAGLVLSWHVFAQPRPCDEFHARLPNVSRVLCQAVDLQPSEGRSVKGRILYVRDVQPRSGPARLRVLVVGGIHGDELSSVSVALH